MNRQELYGQINKKKSYLCVGLDTDREKIPAHLHSSSDPVFEFNRQIIDSTKDLCVCYKINTAFYEISGGRGWETMQKTLDHIPDEHFVIADAKRGDIGNTSGMYAKAFFDTMDFDAVTVSPYMGADSVKPFLEFAGKWVIVLALTSNSGSHDFQMLETGGMKLYEQVLETARSWGSPDNMMFVAGATRAAMLEKMRGIIPHHFMLVPGVGAQGGSLEEVSMNGMNNECGLLVNSSRGIIYAGRGEDFAEQARIAATEIQQEMARLLASYQTA
jgi:orotidine-5'-phosphate decarboxylase